MTSRRSSPGKTKANVKPKPDGKKKAGEKSKPAGKEKAAGMDTKMLAAKIAIAVVVLVVILFLFVGRKRDYSAERQAVLSYIGSNMPKAKFDSWHGEGIGKGCTTKTGAKIPDNSVVLRAHVTVGDKLKYKKDIVFIVVNGRVTDEIDPRDFRLPGSAGK